MGGITSLIQSMKLRRVKSKLKKTKMDRVIHIGSQRRRQTRPY